MNDDNSLFREAIKGIKPIRQDTIAHPKKSLLKQNVQKKNQTERDNNLFYFSDEYQPLLKQDPVRYVKEGADIFELKKLRRGFYDPELFLDLHGMTQDEAKKELAALITAAMQKQIHCASVMFGHGKNILKNQTPMWLAQHPDVLAFHQAPKVWGGDAALLILFDVKETDLFDFMRGR